MSYTEFYRIRSRAEDAACRVIAKVAAEGGDIAPYIDDAKRLRGFSVSATLAMQTASRITKAQRELALAAITAHKCKKGAG